MEIVCLICVIGIVYMLLVANRKKRKGTIAIAQHYKAPSERITYYILGLDENVDWYVFKEDFEWEIKELMKHYEKVVIFNEDGEMETRTKKNFMV